MDNNERAHNFFRLAEQYSESARLLLDTLINNGNSNAGIGHTIKEAQQKSEINSSKSDLYLFIPAIFNCLQCTELFIKGLLLLAGKEFKKCHEVEDLIKALQENYPEDSDVNFTIKAFYGNQIGIIEKFKQTNKLVTSKDLYMALRYPEIQIKQGNARENITIDYIDLFCNGNIGIEQFKILASSLKSVKLATVKEYHNKCPL